MTEQELRQFATDMFYANRENCVRDSDYIKLASLTPEESRLYEKFLRDLRASEE